VSDGKRLFVGVRVSVGTANALAGAAETLQRKSRDAGVDIRWVAPVNYHVTLKFLGWTRDDTIAAVGDRIAEALVGAQRLSFRTARLGAFPSLDKATVVWAGVPDGDPLVEIAKRIDGAVAQLGFAPDKRAFHPHVTLGRLRDPRSVRDVILLLSEQMFGDTRIDSVTLFESETKSSGSVYREVRRIGFSPAETRPERQTRTVELDPANPSSEPDETDDGWPRGHDR